MSSNHSAGYVVHNINLVILFMFVGCQTGTSHVNKKNRGGSHVNRHGEDYGGGRVRTSQ